MGIVVTDKNVSDVFISLIAVFGVH